MKKSKIGNIAGDCQVRTSVVEDYKKDLIEHRKTNFAVKIERDERNCLETGEISLWVTANGYQWNTIRLLSGEVERVVEALKPFIPNKPIVRSYKVGDRVKLIARHEDNQPTFVQTARTETVLLEEARNGCRIWNNFDVEPCS